MRLVELRNRWAVFFVGRPCRATSQSSSRCADDTLHAIRLSNGNRRTSNLPTKLPAFVSTRDINPDSENDPDVASLLGALGHMPFAVTLMAKLGLECQSTAKVLLEAWLKYGPDIFDSDDPEQSMNRSISLSVESCLVQRNPNVITLLAILSLLIDLMDTARCALPDSDEIASLARNVEKSAQPFRTTSYMDAVWCFSGPCTGFHNQMKPCAAWTRLE